MTAMQQPNISPATLRRNRAAVTFVGRAMRFIGVRKLWLVVATLSLIATPAFASATLTFVCDGDLVVRPECCCSGGEHGGTVGAASKRASVSAACCCRVSRADARTTPAVSPPRVAAQVNAKILLSPIAVLSIDSLVPTQKRWPAVPVAQPPPRAVPILLAKQSFLV